MNPFTLTFPKELERKFLKEYYAGSVTQINISSIFGAVFFASFSALDYYLVPEYFIDFLLMRVGIGWMIIGAAILIINKSKDKKISQPTLTVAVILLAILLMLFIYIAAPKLNSAYFIGIILINFWAYAFLRLRYIWSASSGIITFLIYLFFSLNFLNLDDQLLVISSAHILASIFAGGSISYALEYYSRKDYLQNQLLKNSLDQNITLNQKISESDRTLTFLEEQRLLQSKALEAAANSIVILNKEGKIIWCNTSFLKLTGYTSDEIIGKSPSVLKSGKHDRIFYKNMWNTVLNGKVWSGEIINKKKNGDLYYEEMIITPVIDKESKQITHFIAIKQDISLRKDMEEELFENEKRLRSLFENATLGIYRSTPSGEILMANNALIKMLGFESFEDLKRREITKSGYLNPNQREEFKEKLNKTGNLIGFESEWRKKDGSIIYIRESSRIALNENGKIVYEGTVEDVTLRKQAEIEITESRKRLQTVFDNLYDAILIHNSDGKIINANNKFLDLYNLSMEQTLDLNIQDIISLENPTHEINEYWQAVMEENKTFMFECKALRPFNNSAFDVEIYLSKIKHGDEYLILATIRDTTEQKEANKKLLISQRAMEMSPAPIFWLTANGAVKYVNIAAQRMLGYSYDELIKMSVPDLDPQWDREFWDNVGYPRLVKQKVDNFETVHVSKTGIRIPVEINSAIIKYEGEELIIAIATDLTERKKTADALIRAKEEAEKSDRFKSEFLAGMSHEIRTPINTILNFVSLIKADLGSDMSGDVAASFNMIDSGSRRLIRTIDSIINMSQLQAGAYDVKIKSVDIINEILNPLVLEFEQQAVTKGLTFTLESERTEINVLADHYTLTQLFVNLFDNAIKYTKTGGVKTIIEFEKDSLVVKVADTGIGISEDFLPTLFDPFLQEEMGYTRTYEGSGLGLALVKKYVEINNAKISVESKKGSGSTFTIVLKLAADKKQILSPH